MSCVSRSTCGKGTKSSPWIRGSPQASAVNASHARIRALGKQATATLKTWRLLRKFRCSTTRITNLAKAVHTLHLATSS
jgi:hypothetical protein